MVTSIPDPLFSLRETQFLQRLPAFVLCSRKISANDPKESIVCPLCGILVNNPQKDIAKTAAICVLAIVTDIHGGSMFLKAPFNALRRFREKHLGYKKKSPSVPDPEQPDTVKKEDHAQRRGR